MNVSQISIFGKQFAMSAGKSNKSLGSRKFVCIRSPSDRQQQSAYQKKRQNEKSQRKTQKSLKSSKRMGTRKKMKSEEMCVKEKICKIMNLENEVEVKVNKILKKNEDPNGFMKKGSRPVKQIRGLKNNIEDSKAKHPLIREVMKTIKTPKHQQQIENFNESNHSYSHIDIDHSRLQSLISESIIKQQNEDLRKNKKQVYLRNQLKNHKFQQIYYAERRKITNQLFLNATRKFNINCMDDIKDLNRQNLKRKFRNTVDCSDSNVDLHIQKMIWSGGNGYENVFKNHQVGHMMHRSANNVRLSLRF